MFLIEFRVKLKHWSLTTIMNKNNDDDNHMLTGEWICIRPCYNLCLIHMVHISISFTTASLVLGQSYGCRNTIKTNPYDSGRGGVFQNRTKTIKKTRIEKVNRPSNNHQNAYNLKRLNNSCNLFYFEWNQLTKYATIGAITPPTRAPIEHAEKAIFLEN